MVDGRSAGAIDDVPGMDGRAGDGFTRLCPTCGGGGEGMENVETPVVAVCRGRVRLLDAEASC